MTFSTLTFILFFFPITIILYFLCPAKYNGARNGILLLASLFFYAWGEPLNVFLILLCVGLTWSLSFHVSLRKKWALLLAIAVNILPLLLYKYVDFLIINANRIPEINIPVLGLILPAGISFYTFQVITYIVDLYRGKVALQKNPAYVALYVFFFPQLIAGPIVRYIDIETQIVNRKITIMGCHEGIRRFTIGLAKKMLIANQAGMVVSAIGNQPESMVGTGLLWIRVISYGIQILFDFSGYSDMAIGIGRIFGFTFLENFDKPYHSVSVTDFWRRWHMSLSGFFRDYVYIPLGGSRVGKKRHIFNLFVVWFLTGLWHGAYWNYALWGIYYFVLLVGEKSYYGKYLEKLPLLVRRTITFFCYMFGWAIFMFESNNILEIGRHILRLFGFFSGAGSISLQQLEIQGHFLVVLLGLLLALVKMPAVVNKVKDKIPVILCRNIIMIVLLILSIFTIASESFNPFIYFRF